MTNDKSINRISCIHEFSQFSIGDIGYDSTSLMIILFVDGTLITGQIPIKQKHNSETQLRNKTPQPAAITMIADPNRPDTSNKTYCMQCWGLIR